MVLKIVSEFLEKIAKGILYLSVVIAPLGCYSGIREDVDTGSRPKVKMILKWDVLKNSDLMPNRLEDIVQFDREFIDASVKRNRRMDSSGHLEDFWRSARQVVEDGQGDCKDRGSFYCSSAEKFGYRPEMTILAHKVLSGHAFSLLNEETREEKYKEKGREKSKEKGLIDRGLLIKPKYNDVTELVRQLNKLYLETGRIKEPWTRYQVIVLDSLGCDWREGTDSAGNWRCLERAADSGKWIEVYPEKK